MNYTRPLLRLFAGLLVAVGTAQAAVAPPLAQSIEANRWKKRLLLVVAPSLTDSGFRRQKELLAPVAAQLNERDFLVFDILYNQLSAADRKYLRQEIKLANSKFAVILIGKDGGIKRTDNQPLAPADLFSMVDQMPMRRQEIRR